LPQDHLGRIEESGDGGSISVVALEETDRRCPWPKEAEASDRDSEEAVTRVVVQVDGRRRPIAARSP
jgi:hypothetical protein